MNKKKLNRLIKLIIGLIIEIPLSKFYYFLVIGDGWEYCTARSWDYTFTGTVCGLTYAVVTFFVLLQLAYAVIEWYYGEWDNKEDD